MTGEGVDVAGVDVVVVVVVVVGVVSGMFCV